MTVAVGVIVWIEDDYYRQANTQEIRLLRTIIETQRPILAEERRFWRSLKPGWNLVITPLDNISQLPHDIEEFADAAAERTQILWGQDDGWQMIGPVRRDNYLYVAVARRGWQGLFEDEDRWVIPIAVILVVTLMCSLLAWSMTRPVRRLQRAVKQLATGDFDMSELNKTYRRHDEIGVLTQEVIDMADALQRLLQSHQQLLRDVSHELRSPLTRLQIALAIARKKDQSELLTGEHDRIERAVGQVDNLVDQMLDLARLQQQDQTELLREKDVVQERVQEWLDDAEIEVSDHKLTLRFEADSASIFADWDWLLVERAFDNLIRNAIRFAPEGSELVIECRLVTDRVALSVRDFGPGVPEGELSRIFDAFTQVDSARDHASGGYGIGLALVSRITELHAGTVIAENQAPGLKVTLSLPTQPQ